MNNNNLERNDKNLLYQRVTKKNAIQKRSATKLRHSNNNTNNSNYW